MIGRLLAVRAPVRDAGLYLASGTFGLVLFVLAENPIHRRWGMIALPAYFIAAGAALLVRGPRARLAVAVAALAAAGVGPMAGEAAARAASEPWMHVQAHTVITEEASRAMVSGENPYAADYSDSPLGRWNEGVSAHYPYMPLHLVLGLTRALGESVLTDARWLFLVSGLVLVWLALGSARAGFDERLLSFQVVLVLATGTLFLPGGYHDLPALGAILAALVLADTERPGASGLALAAAAAMKQVAVVAAPLIAVALFRRSRRDGYRFALAFAVPALAIVLPFFLWDPGSFVEDAVLFPLDLGREATIAQAPTIGGLIVGWFTGAEAAAVAAVMGAVAALGLGLIWKRCHSVAEAATAAALVLAAAVLLAPTGRAGYVIYPLNLAVWGAVLLRGREQGEPEAV